MENEITLPQAAAHLGLPWYAAHRLALRGELGPIRQIAGRWLITNAGIAAYLARAAAAAASAPSTSAIPVIVAVH